MTVIDSTTRADLLWLNRMCRAHATLSEHQRALLSAWMAAGRKRTEWPGWNRIVGPRPRSEQAVER